MPTYRVSGAIWYRQEVEAASGLDAINAIIDKQEPFGVADSYADDTLVATLVESPEEGEDQRMRRLGAPRLPGL